MVSWQSWKVRNCLNLLALAVADMKQGIRSARIEQGWTQSELARRVGVSRQTINSIENGRAIPTLKIALKLAVTLSKAISDLFHLDAENRARAY